VPALLLNDHAKSASFVTGAVSRQSKRTTSACCEDSLKRNSRGLGRKAFSPSRNSPAPSGLAAKGNDSIAPTVAIWSFRRWPFETGRSTSWERHMCRSAR
jgi:hypothetical protein